jgi:SAM-dependent methyltransferase
VFKGPVLEWYFKVKWRLESKNFTYYNQLIGDRKRILDIGCGYGYLSFFLHYKNEEREITGIDYDEEKIEIAANSYNKTSNLRFVSLDIMAADLGTQDVLFLNDVLHYLSQEKQCILLDRCAGALAPGGLLFIRDGITDLTAKHQNTKKQKHCRQACSHSTGKPMISISFHPGTSATLRRGMVLTVKCRSIRRTRPMCFLCCANLPLSSLLLRRLLTRISPLDI